MPSPRSSSVFAVWPGSDLFQAFASVFSGKLNKLEQMGSASNWLKICFNTLEALPRAQRPVFSIDFMHSFLRHHFAQKPAVALRK